MSKRKKSAGSRLYVCKTDNDDSEKVHGYATKRIKNESDSKNGTTQTAKEQGSFNDLFEEFPVHPLSQIFQRKESQREKNDFIAMQMKFNNCKEDDIERSSAESFLVSKRCPSFETQYSPVSSIPLTPSNYSLAKMSPSHRYNQEMPSSEQSMYESIESIETNESSLGFALLKTPIDNTYHLKKYLQRNYVTLKEGLDPDGVADRLCESDVMGDADRRKIEEARSHGKKSDILLKCLVRYSEKVPKGDRFYIERILDAMKKEKSEYLFEDFQREFKAGTFTNQDDLEDKTGNVADAWKEKLICFEKTIGDEIDPKQIIDKLLQKEVIEFAEHENIQDVQFKPDKLKCLIRYIQEKTVKEYNSFIQVVKEEYPRLSDVIEYELMDISTNPEQGILPVFRINQISSTCSSSKTNNAIRAEFSMTLQGDGREIEKMVVDRCSSETNMKMTEEMMEYAASEVQSVEFSSIHLKLKHLSSRSQMMLFEKLKESPEQLATFIQQMFKSEHYHQFSEKGINLIDFKIEVTWPDAIISRNSIAENYCFLKEKIEPKCFVDMLKSAKVPAEKIAFLESEMPKSERCMEFLLLLVNDENSPIDCFYAKLKELQMFDIINVLLDPSKQSGNRMCPCKLTKSIIVKHFSELETGMTDIDDVLKTFAEFLGFDDKVREFFRLLSKNGHLNNILQKDLKGKNKRQARVERRKEEKLKADTCLRKLLQMSKSETGVELCLLEEILRQRTKGQELLKRVLEEPAKKKEYILTLKDLQRNRTYLQNELEPRRFMEMLREVNGIEFEREDILSSLSRQERCKKFLHILETKRTAMEKFGHELKRLHLTKIADFLLDSRVQGSGEYQINKADVKRNAGFLQEEIEPRKFLNMLRDIKGTNDVIEKILSSTPRRMRCSCFYDFLLHAQENTLDKFQLELKRLEMFQTVRFLINSRPGRFQDTTSVKEALIQSYKHIVDEIEPLCMKHIFVEREVYSDDEFDRLFDSLNRRTRAVSLMQSILRGPVSMSYCLMNALDAVGYDSLAKIIRKEMETYRQCPRLYKKRNGIDECFVVEGKFKVETSEAEKCSSQSKEDIQLPSQTLNSEMYVKQWLDNIDDSNGQDDDHQANNAIPVDTTESTTVLQTHVTEPDLRKPTPTTRRFKEQSQGMIKWLCCDEGSHVFRSYDATSFCSPSPPLQDCTPK